MKTVKWHLIAILFTMFIALPHSVMAHGLGVAVEGGTGRLKTTDHPFYGEGSDNRSYDQDRAGIGIVYDTNVGRDALFNYRLGILYQKLDADGTDSRLDLDGFTVESDYGFGIYRSDLVRLWLGPEVRLEYLEGHGNRGPYDYTEHTLSLGLGPVLGLNYHLNNDLSLVMRGGYIFQTGIKLFSDWDERFGFMSLGLMMRMGEK